MSGPNLRRGPGRRKSRGTGAYGSISRTAFRPQAEAVEARVLLTTYTVGPSGANYTSITAAVAQTNANPSNSNVIQVAPGHYFESNITITAPVTLISTGGAASTIIDGSNATTPQDGIIDVFGNSGNVTIGAASEGFTLENAPYNPNTQDINLIDINGINAPVTIQANTLIGRNGVNNPFDTGILAENTPIGSPINIAINTFQGMWQGIFFQQTVGAGSISNNLFQNLVPSTDSQLEPPEGIFALTLGGSQYNVSGLFIISNVFQGFDGLAITVDGGYQGFAPAQFSNTQIISNIITSFGVQSGAPSGTYYQAGILLIDDPGTSGTDGSQGGVINSGVADNTIQSTTACIPQTYGVWSLGPNKNLTVDNNYIQNLDRGVLSDYQVLGAGYATGLLVNQNYISGNNIGVANLSTNSANLIDASYNYWGVTDATSVKAQANGGVNVNYNPWLGDGTDTSGIPGFQPNLTPAITDAIVLSGPDSVQANSPYTLFIQNLENSSNSAHIGTISSYTVNWGDGTITNYPSTNTTPQHTYNPSSQTTYTISATATNTSNQTFQIANTLGVTVTKVSTLVVTTLTPTTSGFHVRFSAPINTSTLSLYASTTAPSPPPPDVTLSGPSGNVRGSLKLDSDGQGFTFVATGPPLAAGNYTVTLVGAGGASNVIQAASAPNYPLDGTASGSTTGSNYTTTFTVPSNSGPTVSVPDFSRGPGQPVIIPAASGTGLPIRISNGAGITSVMLVLTYDPTLLTIDPTMIALGPNMPAGSTFVYNATIPGRLAICITSPTSLPSGSQDLIELNASIPTSAPYRSKAVLQVALADVNNSTTFGVGDQAVQDVTFLGNASGSGRYTSADAGLIEQVSNSSLSNPGFPNYPLVDPRIIGDIVNSSSSSLTSADAGLIEQAVNGPSYPPQIPAYTGPPANRASGPDPLLSIPRTLAGMSGDTLTVPVQLLQTNGSPIELQSFNLVLSFDPSTFDVSDVRLGDLASGFQLTESVDEAHGLIFISGSSAQPMTLAPGTLGDLVEMDFTILAGVKVGSYGINLLDNSGTSITSLNGGDLTLVPAPTNAGNDPNDGLVAIGGRRAEMAFGPGRSPSTSNLPPSLKATSSTSTSTTTSTPTTTLSLPAHDLAIESLAADSTTGTGSPSSPISLTLGVAEEASPAVVASNPGQESTTGAGLVGRRVAFRHQALARIIATSDPSK